MGFLSSCSSNITSVWMHNMDTNKTHRAKARWELHKNATCHFEQILLNKGSPYKTTVVLPITRHVR